MPQSVGDFKAKFNAMLCELLDKKGSSSKHLSNEKYKWIVYRLSELSENPTLSKSSQDYRMMNKYDILLVTIDGVTTKKLKEKGSDRIYVDCENIFDAINTENCLLGTEHATLHTIKLVNYTQMLLESSYNCMSIIAKRAY